MYRRIVVVGAGIAGLAAARALAAHGCEVVVLEARERTGGRCWTVDGIDLGAHWIHGTEGNPVTTAARELALDPLFVGGDSTYAGGWAELEVHGPDGRLSPEERERSILLIDELRDRIDTLRRSLHEQNGADMSLSDAIARALADQSLTARERMHLDWHLTLLARDDWSAGAQALSVLWWDEGYEVYGYGDSVLRGGMQSLTEALARGLDVRLGSVVNRIAVDSQGEGVEVTASGKTFRADAVVVTLPLGVLKSGRVTFEPALPGAKQAAIARLGVGAMNKVVLRYGEPFWPKNQYAWGYVCDRADTQPATVVNLWKTHRQPALAMVVGGDTASELERRPPHEVRDWAVAVVRAIFGDAAKEPHSVTVTAWQKDPFSLGSYSYLPVGTTPDDIEALSEPAHGRIFFAGEATNRHHWACVHGAYVSGLREAARMTGDAGLLPSRHFTENRRWREMLQRADRLFNLIGRNLDGAEIKRRVEVLRRNVVFDRVPVEDLRVLASMFEPQQFAAGETICRAGERATTMFAVVSGEVLVHVDDNARPVASIGPGDVVGEYGLFATDARTATLVAKLPTEVLALDYQRFERFLLAFPESMFALMQLTVKRFFSQRRSSE